MADSFKEDSFTPDAPPEPRTLRADLPEGWVANIPGGVRETLGLEYRPGARTVGHTVYQPQGFLEHAAQAAITAPLVALGGEAGALLPLAKEGIKKKAAPVLSRIAAAGALGAAEHPEARTRGALTGAASQTVGEIVGPLSTLGAQRLTARAFNALSDRLADQVMDTAKKLVPEWASLKGGHEGLRELMEGKGQEILAGLREGAEKTLKGGEDLFARWASHPELAKTLQSYNNGMTLAKTLQALKAFDTKTGKLNPTALAEGVAKLTGKTRDSVFRLMRLNAEAGEAMGAASKAARGPKGEAPTTIKFPWLRGSGHHVGASEVLPFSLATRHVGPTETEAAVRALAPSVAGALTQATPYPGLPADVLRLPRAKKAE